MFGPPLASGPLDVLLDGQEVADGIGPTVDAFVKRGGQLLPPKVTRLEAIEDGQRVRVHLEGSERVSSRLMTSLTSQLWTTAS